MERDSNQAQTQQPILCRAGCGFYGNSAFEGMCSKCYKESVKRKQSPPMEAGRSSPNTGSMSSSYGGTTVQTARGLLTPELPKPSSITSPLAVSSPIAIASNPNTDDIDALDAAVASPSTSEGTSPDDKMKKRNRCNTCRKKVGLTGFECRCGGMYCGIHRYSDKHDCGYDYRADARSQIAKQNPVIVGEKVKKI